MELAKLNVMYGHLEGTEGKFARDPSGYLSIDAGIKYRGFELSGGYYMRRVDDFETEGGQCGKGWKELVPVGNGGPHLRTRCTLA